MENRTLLNGLVLIIFLLKNSPYSHADVNLKGGNFYISYDDIIIDEEFKFRRTYNSKATNVGMFGYGWNSVWEGYVQIGPSGEPIYRSHGFNYLLFNKTQSDSSNEVLLSNIKALTKLIAEADNRSDIDQIEEELLNSEGTRFKQWERFYTLGKLSPKIPEIGDMYTYYCACNYNKHLLARTPEGYEISVGEEVYKFNLQGLLTSFKLTNKGKEILISRNDSSGLIEKIELGKKTYFLSYTESGFVKSITNHKGEKVSSYSYDGDDLVSHTNASKETYNFKYDVSHNITEIHPFGETPMKIEYMNKTLFVSKITKPDGMIELYRYGSLKDGDPNLNYYTEIEWIKPDRKGRPSTERHEWRTVKNKYGETNNTVRSVIENHIRIDHTFDENEVLTHTTQSSAITGTKLEIKYKFDDKGRVTNLDSENWSKSFEYNEIENKLKKIKTITKGEPYDYSFTYSNGLLSTAALERRNLKIHYNKTQANRISYLTLDGNDIHFIYAENGLLSSLKFSDKKSIQLNCSLETGCSFIEMDAGLQRELTGLILGINYLIRPANYKIDLAQGKVTSI
ncbi:MAG: DUF6531 domain-containing protein [Oleiphilus sp.]